MFNITIMLFYWCHTELNDCNRIQLWTPLFILLTHLQHIYAKIICFHLILWFYSQYHKTDILVLYVLPFITVLSSVMNLSEYSFIGIFSTSFCCVYNWYALNIQCKFFINESNASNQLSSICILYFLIFILTWKF